MTAEEQQAYDALVAERDGLIVERDTLTNDMQRLKDVDLAVALETVEKNKSDKATQDQLVLSLQRENARLVMQTEQPELHDKDLFKGLGRKGTN